MILIVNCLQGLTSFFAAVFFMQGTREPRVGEIWQLEHITRICWAAITLIPSSFYFLSSDNCTVLASLNISGRYLSNINWCYWILWMNIQTEFEDHTQTNCIVKKQQFAFSVGFCSKFVAFCVRDQEIYGQQRETHWQKLSSLLDLHILVTYWLKWVLPWNVDTRLFSGVANMLSFIL